MSKRSAKKRAAARNRDSQQESDDSLDYIPPRNEERLLINQTTTIAASKILCISTGRAQLAGFLASQHLQAKVVCHYFDTKHALLASEYWQDCDAPFEIICTPDFPDELYDAVCLPVLQQGNAELNRELLQQAHQRLEIGGTLHAVINNPNDKWLHEQLQKIFPKVTRIARKTGTCYSAKKTAPLKRVRKYQAEFPVKLHGQELNFITRPLVYSHRSIDAGTWALMRSLEIKPGNKVLDLGCGSGAIGIAAILSAKDVNVTAIDSCARAIDCTKKNAKQNLTNELLAKFQIIHSHTDEKYTTGKFDVVAINPPYFQHLTLAEKFISSAKKALNRNGKILFVTKMPDWYHDYLPKFFRKVNITPSGDYWIVQGKQ